MNTDIFTKEENKRLNDISNNSLYGEYPSDVTVIYSYKILERYLKKGNILELGPAEGIMTKFLVQKTDNLVVVEGGKKFCDDIKKRHPEVTVINSLFETFQTNEKFDNIILGHVLEHVENPVEILKHIKQFLKPNGIIFAAIPNCNSIHRQAAVLMGLQEKLNSMSELDIHHGHRRVYSIEEFKNDFISAGLKIEKLGGYWLKPVSNKQIKDSWTPEMLSAFMELGEKYPEIAAEIYVVAGL